MATGTSEVVMFTKHDSALNRWANQMSFWYLPSPHAPFPGVSTILHGWFKTCCLTLKNKCIRCLCTFKSLPKAKCLPCVLPPALVFASVNRGGLGCCCMQLDLVWTWVDKCWEHALDQPTHVFEKSESSEWGANHSLIQSTLATLCRVQPL